MSVKRGRMDEYPILQGRYTYLLRELSAHDVKDHLHQDNILDRDDLDKISSGETPKAQTEILLGILSSRRNAFPVFLRVLRKTGYEHVADELAKYRDEGEDPPVLPPSSKLRRKFESEQMPTRASISREFWKCEDTMPRSQQDADNMHKNKLLQEIASRKKGILVTNEGLREQEIEVSTKIRSVAATQKGNIEMEEEQLRSDLKRKYSKLADCNKDELETLYGLERKVKSSRTIDERRVIEMELEEVKVKTEQVALVFNEYKPTPINLGRVDIQSSSGKIYKGDTYWNRRENVKPRLQTDTRDPKLFEKMDTGDIQRIQSLQATLKFAFSSKLPDDDMDNCGLTDIAVMSDGTVVITDGLYTCVKSFWYGQNKELCYSRLPLAEPPWQVTRLSLTTVAVSIPSLKQIWILAVKPELSLEKVLRMDKEYRGLVRMDSGDLAASAIHSYTPCIDIIDMQGNVKRRLYSAKTGPTFMDRLWYLGVTHEGDILASDISKTRLLCVSKEGKEIVRSTYRPEWEDCLEDPHGVCCDRDGNVYLARSTTNEIWCLSADGLGVVGNLSLNHEVPIRKPWGLCVNDDGWLYVAESDGMVKAFLITKN